MGEQKGGNGVQILTAAGVHGKSCWLEGKSEALSIKRKLKCFNFVFGAARASARLDLYTRRLAAGSTQKPTRVRPQRIDASHVVTH